jgi:hypothetical protein
MQNAVMHPIEFESSARGFLFSPSLHLAHTIVIPNICMSTVRFSSSFSCSKYVI